MKKIIILYVLLIVGNAWGDTTVPEYFVSLNKRYSAHYNKKISMEYENMCEELGLEKDNSQNKKKYSQIMFFHELFTGQYCINFSSGGVFNIPYVFHWTTPNPRHEIKYLQDNVKLSSVSPPNGFKQYKTFADIDRVPSLYIGDLFSKEPKYYHPKCGSFYTFGWCSEREMAYNALMSLFGYTCKIKQEGIHTWSEVWLTFDKSDGTPCNIIAVIDNSVDIEEWQKAPENLVKESWLRDYGKGTQINWYNKMARSNDQLEKLKNTAINRDQVEWIENRVKEWLGI